MQFILSSRWKHPREYKHMRKLGYLMNPKLHLFWGCVTCIRRWTTYEETLLDGHRHILPLWFGKNSSSSYIFLDKSSGVRGTSSPHPHQEFIHSGRLSDCCRVIRCRITKESIYYPNMTPSIIININKTSVRCEIMNFVLNVSTI